MHSKAWRGRDWEAIQSQEKNFYVYTYVDCIDIICYASRSSLALIRWLLKDEWRTNTDIISEWQSSYEEASAWRSNSKANWGTLQTSGSSFYCHEKRPWRARAVVASPITNTIYSPKFYQLLLSRILLAFCGWIWRESCRQGWWCYVCKPVLAFGLWNRSNNIMYPSMRNQLSVSASGLKKKGM